jgi:hypothetical protein
VWCGSFPQHRLPKGADAECFEEFEIRETARVAVPVQLIEIEVPDAIYCAFNAAP